MDILLTESFISELFTKSGILYGSLILNLVFVISEIIIGTDFYNPIDISIKSSSVIEVGNFIVIAIDLSL